MSREVTFGINKYKKAVMLNTKETIAQTVINALLMVPGNLISNPLVGANIMQYLYHKIEDIDTDKIMNDLQFAIGDTLGDNVLSDISVVSIRDRDGDVMVVTVRLRMPDTREDDSLVVLLKKKESRVHFNYKFMSDVLDIIS